MAKSKKTKVVEMDELDFEDVPKSPVKEKKPRKKKEQVPTDTDEETVTIEEPGAEEPAPPAPEEKEPEPVIIQKEVQIKGATLVDDLFCSFNYDLFKDNEFQVNIKWNKSQKPIHQDLGFHFSALDHHLAGICEELTGFELDTILEQNILPSKAAAFKVTSFKLEGKPKVIGVILSGVKKLSTGQEVKLETPLTKWGSGYLLIDHLEAAINHCVNEVELYKNGKQAPVFVQQSLPFFDGEMKITNEDEFDINKTIEGKKDTIDGEDFYKEATNDMPMLGKKMSELMDDQTDNDTF